MKKRTSKTVITCDRCGKKIKTYTEKDGEAYEKYLERVGALQVRRAFTHPLLGGETVTRFFEIDLCEECDASFRKWYEGGK